MKFVTIILSVVCIFMGAVIYRMNGEIERLNRVVSATDTQRGSFELREMPDSSKIEDLEPTEEDSIRAWEEREALTERLSSKDKSTPITGIRKVYLTFDDGPSRNTSKILDILKEYGVKATFFVVGEGKSSYEDMYKRVVEEGHTLGMHSYSHVYKDIYSSRESFIEDLNKIQDYLHDVTGVYPDYYRFPGGSSTGLGKADMSELTSYLEEIGVEWFDWNISSGDATERLNADQICRNATARIPEYTDAVILFHDTADKASTVEALPKIIETIMAMKDTVIVPIGRDSNPLHH